MDIFTTYSVRIDRFTRIFQDTVNWYRRSVDFFIRVILLEKEELFRLKTQKERINAVEKITVITSCRPEVKYDFGKEFYKFPCYYRRAAFFHKEYTSGDQLCLAQQIFYISSHNPFYKFIFNFRLGQDQS